MIIDNIFVLTESLIMLDDDDLEISSTDHTVFSSNLSFVGPICMTLKYRVLIILLFLQA
jgi:hypothetical protein